MDETMNEDLVDVSETNDADKHKAKKPRSDDVEWRITFDQTQGIRTLVDVVGNILNRVNFRINYDSEKMSISYA